MVSKIRMVVQEKPRLLVHCCCAHCLLALRRVIPDDYAITGFWYNPNIQPYGEYLRRRNAAVVLSERHHWPLVSPTEPYPLLSWLGELGSRQRRGERRCVYCYRQRLRATAAFARAHSWAAMTSTLAVSPYQDETLLKELGDEAAAEYGVRYLHVPATEQYYPAKQLARDEKVYLQHYCGCVFSLQERRREQMARRQQRNPEP